MGRLRHPLAPRSSCREPRPFLTAIWLGRAAVKGWLLNRGFGGSTMADVVFYMDRIVTPHQPRLVVLYADNDMAHGLMPDRVLAGYRALVARLRSALPATRLAFVAIKPSPSRRAYLDRMRETNRRIRADIARDSLQTYVDVFTPMLDRKGQPRPELFEADSLHLTRAGYLLWRSLLAPVVR